MRIRCPHCQNPLEVLDDDPLTEVDCPSCGSHFSFLAQLDTASWDGSSRRTLAHFELLEQVGVGHFGAVWKSRDTRLDRLVAIKLPRPDRVNQDHLAQFLREARAAAQLRHPHIVPVHEVGQADGALYIVSDFVQGCTLREWLTGQRPTPREAARLVTQVALALHYAHEAGVIHRDLKPGNIMLDMAGEPHLLDFGLARRESGEITVTVEGRILGTPAYMSPEQARGQAHEADRRSDVYSLGVILFELLTGELPFRGDTRMLIVQILKDEPPSPRRLNGNVSRDLETICLKCLQKSPENRYPTANALAADLQRWLDGRPIQARPVGSLEKTVRWAHREPRIAALAASLIFALLGGLSAVSWQWRVAVAATKTAERNLEETNKQRERRDLNFDRAMSAVDRMLTHVGEHQLSQVPQFAPIRKGILEDALKLYQELLKEKGDDPDLLTETARAQLRVASIHWLLQDSDAALGEYEQAIERFGKVLERDPSNLQAILGKVACYRGRAGIFSERQQYKDAVVAHEQAQKLLLGLPETSEIGRRERLFGGGAPHAEALLAAGDPARAAQLMRVVCESGEALLKEDPDRYALGASFSYERLGTALDRMNADVAEREQVWRRCVELTEKLADQSVLFLWTQVPLSHLPDSDHRTTWASILAARYERFAEVLELAGKRDELAAVKAKAQDIYTRSVARIETNIARKTADWALLQGLAINASAQARRHRRERQNQDAIHYFQKALDAYAKLASESPEVRHYQTAAIGVGLELAEVLASESANTQETAVILESMLQRTRELAKLGADDHQLQLRLVHALKAAAHQTRFNVGLAESEPLIRSTLAAAEQLPEGARTSIEGRELLAWGHHNLADVLNFTRSQQDQSCEHYEQARTLQEQIIKEHGLTDRRAVDLGWTCQNGGNALLNTKPGPHVVHVAVRGAQMRVYLVERNVPDTKSALNDSLKLLGRSLAFVSDPFADDVQEALLLSTKQTSQADGDGLAWRVLGLASFHAGKLTDAIDALDKSIAAKNEEPAIDHFFLAQAYSRTGRKDDASLQIQAGQQWVAAHRASDRAFKILEGRALEAMKETGPRLATP